MTKYSIILRAYNVEDKVSRSIDSVIAQSYKNWELVIVDDGSTDRTGEICDNYALKDKRIVVVHQENKGCVLATQNGIAHSTGEYICLLDADDWYSCDYLERVELVVINNSNIDMIICNYYVVDSMGEKSEFSLTKADFIATNKEAMEIFLKTTNHALWNKVVKKDKIRYTEEEMLFFSQNGKNTNFGEDLYQLIPVLCECENIYFTSYFLYNYMLDEQSISHQNVKNPSNELLKRTCLMAFVYETIKNCGYLDGKIKKIIEFKTLELIIPNILEIIKKRDFCKHVKRQIKQNMFYNSVIKKIKFLYILKKFGKKRAIAFTIFNLTLYLG